jgi:tRNA threonylcarbamoyladenosine biosynthesis protein TsaB
MKILGVESSATAASVAVYSDGKIIAQSFSNTGLTHSQTLLPMVEDTLKIANISLSDVDYLAISNGPGSFTGVRIGVSAVKGMAQPLEIPCVEVSTLEAIAKPLENSGCLAVSVMDARCNQVYTAQFDCLGGFNRVTQDEAITINELADKLKVINKPIVLIGDGTQVAFNKLKDMLSGIYTASPSIRYQSASSVCLIAAERISNGDNGVNAHSVLPNYLRLSQAERELKNKNK